MQTLTAGTTSHLLSGSKYQGAWELAEVASADTNGWQQIKSTDGATWFTRPEDAFATEAEARTEAKARRQPRRQRQTAYGDMAQLAAFTGTAKVYR